MKNTFSRGAFESLLPRGINFLKAKPNHISYERIVFAMQRQGD